MRRVRGGRLAALLLLVALGGCGGGSDGGGDGNGGGDGADGAPSLRDADHDGSGGADLALPPDDGTGGPDAAPDTPGTPEPDARDAAGTDARTDAATATGPVVLNEVVAATLDGSLDWLEIYNRSAARVDVSGWSVRDDDDTHTWALPEGTSIAAGGFLLLSQADPAGGPGFPFGLGSTDAARLYDATGALVDQTTWPDGAAPAGRSWGRWPDGTGPFATLTEATATSPNAPPWHEPTDVVEAPDAGGQDVPEPDVAPDAGADVPLADVPLPTDTETGTDVAPDVGGPPPIVVNEVMARDPLGGPDWVELMNLGATPVAVGGFLVADDPEDPLEVWDPLPAGRVVPAHGFLVLYGKDAPQGEDFSFAFNSDESFAITLPDGTTLDETTWLDGQAPQGGSWGRYPDGTGAFATLPAATPGQPNEAP